MAHRLRGTSSTGSEAANAEQRTPRPGFPSNRGAFLIADSCNFAVCSDYRTPVQLCSLTSGARPPQALRAARPAGAGPGPARSSCRSMRGAPGDERRRSRLLLVSPGSRAAGPPRSRGVLSRPGPLVIHRADPAQRAARDDCYLLLRIGHGFLRSQVLIVAGSLGCGVSGVSSVVIHGSSGSAFTMASISALSLARYKPRARP